METRFATITTVLRIAFGLMATLAGMDKFFNLLADWDAYVAPIATQMLPFSPSVFMGIIGVVEFAVGIAILAVQPRLGAYVASAWLLLVAVNLVLGGHFDVAVRDLVLSISAFALGELLGAPETVRAPRPVNLSPVTS